MSIKEFYNTYIFNQYGVKKQIKSGNISDFYQNLKYINMAALVNVADDASLFKTIHKSKGDEFDNILLIIPGSKYPTFLTFLLSPDMNKEEHRVYYVALSRAKKNLYVNLPKLSEEEMKLIKNFDKKILSKELVFN